MCCLSVHVSCVPQREGIVGGLLQSRDTGALAALRRADPNPRCSHRPSLCTSCCHPLEVNAACRSWGCLDFLLLHRAKELQFYLLLKYDHDVPACLCRVLLNSERMVYGNTVYHC